MTETSSSQIDTRSKIVDVATRLLHEQGPSAVTTRRVAEHAGIQAPTIYRLFGDKDGLMEAVAEHVMSTFVAAKAATVLQATVYDTDPLDDLRAGWEAQIDFGIANPSLFRFLSDPARALSSPAVQAGMAVLRARVHRIAVDGRLGVGEDRAVDLIRAGGIGAVTTILATPLSLRDPGLAEAVFDGVLQQILTDRPLATDGGAAAVAITFRAMVPELHALTVAERQLLTEWLDRVSDES